MWLRGFLGVIRNSSIHPTPVDGSRGSEAKLNIARAFGLFPKRRLGQKCSEYEGTPGTVTLTKCRLHQSLARVPSPPVGCEEIHCWRSANRYRTMEPILMKRR